VVPSVISVVGGPVEQGEPADAVDGPAGVKHYRCDQRQLHPVVEQQRRYPVGADSSLAMTANSTGAVKTAPELSRLLPWATDSIPLANSDVLELGSGPGLTADWLWPRVATLTAIEYDGRCRCRRPYQTVCRR
jgi:hypothetical protein